MPQPLTDAINALTTYANTVTGKTPPDTTLSDAVATLASGYGGGGWSVDDIALHNITGDIVVTTSRIETYAFAFLKMESITSSTVTTIATYAFSSAQQLKSVDFPAVTSISGYAFNNCSALETINVRNATSVSGGYVFQNCSKLVYLSLPKNTSATGSKLTRGCSLLERVELKCSRIDAQGLDNCPKLATVVLRKTDAITTLSNISAFSNTPFASGGTGGTLYVPANLKTQYEQANNWSTILGYANNSIQAIEGSYYETHYVDGTPIE